ncbi:MAG TPA: hypothetical protein VFB12_03875, partial [Ktedonobacteraceae bacterium]|nr:hypothetical protein [Ktedonobacteraceae bacterium]
LDVMPMPFVTLADPLQSTSEGSPDLSGSRVFPRYPGQRTRWGWRQIPLDALSLDRNPTL